MVLLPVILLTGWLALWLGPSLAVWALGQPLHEWLGMITISAMRWWWGGNGVRLNPYYFSLAEDALFSVPRH